MWSCRCPPRLASMWTMAVAFVETDSAMAFMEDAHQSRLLYELCKLLLAVLWVSPDIEAVARPLLPRQVTPAGVASMLLGASMALMRSCSATRSSCSCSVTEDATWRPAALHRRGLPCRCSSWACGGVSTGAVAATATGTSWRSCWSATPGKCSTECWQERDGRFNAWRKGHALLTQSRAKGQKSDRRGTTNLNSQGFNYFPYATNTSTSRV
ncbi:uncharacterized protein [Miscanthus floridulus]|uniref:uncharacterized protein n=1 Tax=Miscanthus floridulus TaxID=154761 RepID=UPI003457B463